MFFTNRPYQRSHGKAPRGTGGWAFQRSRTEVAYDADRYGAVEIFYGTFTQAKAEARQSMNDAAFIAVCS